jgi:hypothetical protein
MSEYTKGEWRLGGVIDADVFCGNKIIAETNPEGYYGDELVDVKEAIANAHLMAAAPDLLEACKLALQLLSPVKHAAYVEGIKQAISKAEGR